MVRRGESFVGGGVVCVKGGNYEVFLSIRKNFMVVEAGWRKGRGI